MASLNVQYLEPDDLAVARTTQKRSDQSAVSNIHTGALAVLSDIKGVSILPDNKETGVVTIDCPDDALLHVQIQVSRLMRTMVPRGHLLGTHVEPRYEQGAGI